MSGTTTTTTEPKNDDTPVVTPPSGAPAPDPKPAAADPKAAEDDDDHEDDGQPPVEDKSQGVKDRIKRAQAKAQKELLASLGVTTVEEALALKQKAEQAELEKLSEKERLQKERDDALKQAELERKTRERIERERQEEAAKSFLRTEAEKAGVDPDAMDLVMSKLEKHVEDNFEDDDELKPGAFKDFFADLKKEKKLWFKPKEAPVNTTPPAQPNQNPSAPAAHKTIDDMDEIEWARYKRDRGLS